MGTRSMNALVIASPHRLSASGLAQLSPVSHFTKADDGSSLWVWETNISPFHTRNAVQDLKEEVAIFEAVMQLPREAYRWVRAGQDQGQHGDLLDHPLLQHPGFLSVLQSFDSIEAEQAAAE